MVVIDINKFRNKEVLNEDIRDYEGANELARKLIQTYANDNARSEDTVPSPQEKTMLDRYLTGFLNSVVFQYGNIVRGHTYSVEELISRWNNLATFFINNINPLYAFYVVDKFSNDIIERVEQLAQYSRLAEGDDAGVNGDAIDLLLRFVRNRVLRPIPYNLLFSADTIQARARELEAIPPPPAADEFDYPPTPPSSDDDDEDIFGEPPSYITEAQQKQLDNIRKLIPESAKEKELPPSKAREARMTKAEKQQLIDLTKMMMEKPDKVYNSWRAKTIASNPKYKRIIVDIENKRKQEMNLPEVRADPKQFNLEDFYQKVEKAKKEKAQESVEGQGIGRHLKKSDKIRRRVTKAMPVFLPMLDAMEGKGNKPKKGKGKKAVKDASLGETPSGYTTSQSYGQKDSKKTVVASYASKKDKKDKK